MKKALITGISSFTGSHLARALIQKGYQVHGFVRPSSRIDSLKNLPISFYQGDLTDAHSVEKAVIGMDVVYHIAASYREAGLPVSAYHAVNVLGTRNVMEACLKHEVERVVHCSTVGVHGHVERPPANEDAPLAPGDHYQTTKVEGEKVVQEYMAKGLNAVIFRPVGIYGPGDLRFLKLFRGIKKGRFMMFGSGEVLYHLTYIDDLIRGILACGEHPKAVGRTYIIAGPQATTLDELTRRIAATMNVPPPGWRLPFWSLWAASVACETLCLPFRINPPLFRRRADFFRKDRSFDSSRIRQELNVQPQVDLKEGLERTVDWYHRERLL